jgi:hypothetical protein
MERLNQHREVPIEPGIFQSTGGKLRSAHMTLTLTYLTRTDCGTLGTGHILPLLRTGSGGVNYASRNSFIRRRKLANPAPATN